MTVKASRFLPHGRRLGPQTQRMLQVPETAFQLTGALDVQLAEKEGEPAKFRMLVTTGSRIAAHWFWENLYVDLSGINIRKQSLPVLLDHDPAQRIGYTTKIKVVKGEGLVAEGFMLSNELAQQVVRDAREGFPWECSCALPYESVERVELDAETKVNGETVKGPAIIWRKTNLREVTFTAVGADQQTKAEVLSRGGRTVQVEILSTEQPNMAGIKKRKGVTQNDAAATAVADDSDLTADDGDGQDGDEGDEVETAPAPQPTKLSAAKRVRAAREEGAAAERQRIASIYRFAKPSQKKLADKLVADNVGAVDALTQLAEDPDRDKPSDDERARLSREIDDAGTAVPDDAELGESREGEEPAEQSRFLALPANRLVIPRGADKASISRLWASNGDKFAGYGCRDIFASEVEFAAFKRAQLGGRFNLHMSAKDSLLAGTASITSPRAYIAAFFMSADDAVEGAWFAQISTKVTSNQAIEVYRWLRAAPSLSKGGGELKFEELGAELYQLANEDWDGGIEVKVKDLRRDPTGQIRTQITELGRVAAEHPFELASSVIVNGTGTTVHGACYDGKAFFATDHPIRKSGTQSNKIDVDISAVAAAVHGSVTAPSPEEARATMNAGASQIRSMKNDQGRLMNRGARSFMVMVPSSLYDAFQTANAAATLANGAANPTSVMRDRFVVVENPDLNASFTDDVVVFRLDAPVAPLIFQEELPTYLTVLGPGSEEEKKHKRHLYSAERSYNIGYGRYQQACLVTMV